MRLVNQNSNGHVLICFHVFSGEDPLLEVLDGRDINSVAGVLKLYFRELRDPLFPLSMFDNFIACSRKLATILSTAVFI